MRAIVGKRQRVGLAPQQGLHARRVRYQVVVAVAVGVVVEVRPQFAQSAPRLLAEAAFRGEAVGFRDEPVAVRADQRPAAVRAAQRRVDDEARADVGPHVDVQRESRVARDLAGVVVVVPGKAGAAFQEAPERGAVGGERDVEHRDDVAGGRVDAFEQRDLALASGQEPRRNGFGQPQLLQRAQAVGVAVADVVARHGGADFARAAATASSIAAKLGSSGGSVPSSTTA
jgi:hypothetical protein